jgi:hypothetical protein
MYRSPIHRYCLKLVVSLSHVYLPFSIIEVLPPVRMDRPIIFDEEIKSARSKLLQEGGLNVFCKYFASLWNLLTAYAYKMFSC